MFNNPHSEAKAAHAAAYFLRKAGGALELLKLMKLMYLAERTSYAYHGRPMIGDEPYSDRHGPVLESVYRSVENENQTEAGPTWRALMAPRDGNDIELKDFESPLKKLSQADRLILDEVWEKHGHRSGSALRKWTHSHCQEYDERSFAEWSPRTPIDIHRLLVAVGFNEEEAKSIAEQNKIDAQLDSLLLKAA